MVRFEAWDVETPACNKHCRMVRAASDILAAAARSISCRHEFKSMAAEEQVGDPRMGASAGDLEMAIVMVGTAFGFFTRNERGSEKNTTGSVC